MRKILIGVVAVIVACAGGYFGLQLYLQHRIAGEVDAALAQIRAGGASATRGSLAFDLSSRTLTIADLAVKSDAKPAIDVKIGRFTAAGVDLMQTSRFVAERVDIGEIEAAGTLALPSAVTFAYKAPRIEIANYAGPSAALRAFDPASPLDLWRFAFEHFAALTATSITVPSVTASIAPAADAKGIGAADYAYSGIMARDIRAGRVASTTVERFSYTSKVNLPGVADAISGEVVALTALDFDSAATLALLDPASAKDDTYHRAYRRLTSGAYTANLGNKVRMRLDSLVVDDLGVRPSRLQIVEILALSNTLQTPPSPKQLEQMMPKLAGIYEGVRIGNLEMRGLSVEAPDGGVHIGLMRFTGLENGKLGKLAFEGLDARGGKSPFRFARFALKGFDIAGLLRMAPRLGPGQKPTPADIADLLHLIEGVDVKNLVTPDGSSGKTVTVETVDLSWGAYVGGVPSKLRATVKMAGPVSARDPDPFKMLAAAGFANASVGLDLGVAWEETTRTITLAPAAAEMGNIGTLTARLTLGNVPREMFSTDPFQVMVGVAVVEAGPVEIVLRDTGGIDLAVAQYARTQNLSREEARKQLMENVRQNAASMAALSADAMAIGGAFARFLETSGGTLTLRLTPKGKVSLMELSEAGKANPLDALSRFDVEVVVGK
jgi:hypothetical protein